MARDPARFSQNPSALAYNTSATLCLPFISQEADAGEPSTGKLGRIDEATLTREEIERWGWRQRVRHEP